MHAIARWRPSTAALVGALIALLGVGIWMFFADSGPAFRKLQLASVLTQKKAIELTGAQIRGEAPLRESELTLRRNRQLRDSDDYTIKDVILSMKEDCATLDLDSVCAMDYNVPISVCYVPYFGVEKDFVMYNLRMSGFSQNTSQSEERSHFCDGGRTWYGCERFDFVWVEFFDADFAYQYLRVRGDMGRIFQHLAWLNQGVTICDSSSAQHQANVLFRVMEEFRPVN